MVSKQVMPAAMTNRPSRNAQYAPMLTAGINQNAPAGDQRQADQDAALVAELPRDQAGGNRHQEIGEIIGRLHEAGLFLVDVQRVLKMLVQDVNHAVAKAPQQKQRGDQRKGDEEVFAVGRAEKPPPWPLVLVNCGVGVMGVVGLWLVLKFGLLEGREALNINADLPVVSKT